VTVPFVQRFPSSSVPVLSAVDWCDPQCSPSITYSPLPIDAQTMQYKYA